MKDNEIQLEEACTNLKTLVTNGNALCLNEMKQMELSREHEIEKLKLSDENNELYINLLRSRKEMNMEFQENNKIILALKEKLMKEIAKKKRKHQKARSYYHSKIEKLATKNTFDLDSQIQELKDEIIVLENEKVEMQQELEYFMANELAPLKNIDGSYTNIVRACFQDLVMSGVGIKQTKHVIMTVLRNIGNIEIDESDLPRERFLQDLNMRKRVCLQWHS